MRILSESIFGKEMNSSTADLSYVLDNVIYAGIPGASKIPGYLYDLQTRCKNLYKNIQDGKDNGNDFNLRELLKKDFSPEDVNEECVGFVLAGFETTASLLTWIILSLASDKRVMNKVQSEIDHILKGRTNPSWKEINPNEDPKTGFHYLSSVISECARLYPPAQFVNRTASTDVNILGFNILKDVRDVFLQND